MKQNESKPGYRRAFLLQAGGTDIGPDIKARMPGYLFDFPANKPIADPAIEISAFGFGRQQGEVYRFRNPQILVNPAIQEFSFQDFPDRIIADGTETPGTYKFSFHKVKIKGVKDFIPGISIAGKAEAYLGK